MAKKMAKNEKSRVKNDNDWKCQICEKIFVHQSSLCKHMSKKHVNKKMAKFSQNGKKRVKNGKFFSQNRSWECIYCKVSYKHQSGLSRHKKKCEGHIKAQLEKELKKESKDEMIHQLLDMLKTQKQVNNTNCHNTTNNINNKININLYLNEDCKNAINLTDFVERIKVSLTDVLKTKNLGYIDGVSQILIKNLENIPQKERPVQCRDVTPLEYYIKDDNKWSKNGTIDSAIGKITKKQAERLKEWTIENPKWSETEEGIKKWRAMQKNIMGSSEELKMTKAKNEIIEKVCENSKIKI